MPRRDLDTTSAARIAAALVALALLILQPAPANAQGPQAQEGVPALAVRLANLEALASTLGADVAAKTAQISALQTNLVNLATQVATQAAQIASSQTNAYFTTGTIGSFPKDKLVLHPVVSLTGIPAGKYILSANVRWTFDGCLTCLDPPLVSCGFVAGNQRYFPNAGFGLVPSDDDTAPFSLTAPMSFAGDDNTVAVACYQLGSERDSDGIKADFAAIRVDALDDQGP